MIATPDATVGLDLSEAAPHPPLEGGVIDGVELPVTDKSQESIDLSGSRDDQKLEESSIEDTSKHEQLVAEFLKSELGQAMLAKLNQHRAQDGKSPIESSQASDQMQVMMTEIQEKGLSADRIGIVLDSSISMAKYLGPLAFQILWEEMWK